MKDNSRHTVDFLSKKVLHTQISKRNFGDVNVFFIPVLHLIAIYLSQGKIKSC